MVTEPGVTPVTTPTGDMVALVLLADHTPPATPSVKVMFEPAITVDAPAMVPAVVPVTFTTTVAATPATV